MTSDISYDGHSTYGDNDDQYLTRILQILFVNAVIISAIGFVIIKRLYFPVIVSHPWQQSTNCRKKDKETTVVLAGSYNPPHYGHFKMLLYLAER